MSEPRQHKDWTPATLASLQAYGKWLWIECPNCGRREARTLAQYVIRFGGELTGEDFARRLRCSLCGRVGLRLQIPKWRGGPYDRELEPFPQK